MGPPAERRAARGDSNRPTLYHVGDSLLPGALARERLPHERPGSTLSRELVAAWGIEAD